jgi:hypothetical protein
LISALPSVTHSVPGPVVLHAAGFATESAVKSIAAELLLTFPVGTPSIVIG